MKKILFVLAAGVVFVACNNADSNKPTTDSTTVAVTPAPAAPDTTKVPDMHTAETAIDYEGTYTGTVPCASCEGIETTVTLNKDKTFTLKEVYKGGKEPGSFDSKGTYELKGNIATLKFAGKDDADRSLAFHVGENQLFMLDADGKVVEGNMAKNYTLTKK